VCVVRDSDRRRGKCTTNATRVLVYTADVLLAVEARSVVRDRPTLAVEGGGASLNYASIIETKLQRGGQ
jgi:hypothetical protein